MLTWIIDDFLEDRNEYLNHTVMMTDAVKQLGLPLIVTKYVPFSTNINLVIDPSIKAITYGTIGFTRQFREKYPTVKPGGFFDSPKFSADECIKEYGAIMLNAYTLIEEFPIEQMADRLPKLNAEHGPLFVRPNGVSKAFSGSVVGTPRYSIDSFLRYTDSCIDTTRTLGETVRVHLPVNIQGEYRFVCTKGEIIAQSQYRFQNVSDKRIDVDPEARCVAELFVNNKQGPDLVYVMDIAVLDTGQARIIEFNNFSNSGMYMCDRVKVVKRVTDLLS